MLKLYAVVWKCQLTIVNNNWFSVIILPFTSLLTCSEEKLPVVIYFSKTEDLIKHYPLESQPFDQLLIHVKYEMCFAKQLITPHHSL